MIIFGILNLSQDSFFQESAFSSSSQAIKRAEELIKNGANCIDIGAQASNPDAQILTVGAEIKKLTAVVQALKAKKISISLDSFNSETQLNFIKELDYINDITAFNDSSSYKKLAQAKCKLIAMHSVQKNSIADKLAIDAAKIMAKIYDFFDDRLESLLSAGIAKDRIILDPGMGFFLSTDPLTSIAVLKNITNLKKRYKLPIMISVSRKSFLRNLAKTDINESMVISKIAEIYAYSKGVEYIRTHDVKELKQALTIWDFLTS